MNKKLILLAKYLEENYLKKESSKIKLLVKEAASKTKALKKIGFSDQVSEEIDDICKGFSMWMAYRLMSHVTTPEYGPTNNEEAIAFLNDNFRRFKRDTSYIMDWVKVGLNGEYVPYKNTPFNELLNLAEEWHDSLEVGEGSINYKENNPIILDFRGTDGIGYYWVDLKTNRSDEECERMGHCGTTSGRNTLYSLRRFIPIGRGFTLNKSLLTAAITPEGKIAQMKGPKNSKPPQEYHQYIIPLLNLKMVDEEGNESSSITGFRPEYGGSDFMLKDITNEQLVELMRTNPSLFDSPAGKILAAIRLNEPGRATDVVGEFIPSKYILKEIISSPGRDSLSIDRIVDIIEDPFELFEWYESSNEDVKYSLDEINEDNKSKIIHSYKAQTGDTEISLDNFETRLIDNFEEFLDTDIPMEIRMAINGAMEEKYYDVITDKTLDVLKAFGEPRIYDGNLFLKINIYDIIRSISSDEQDTALNILEELNDANISSIDYLAENFFERMVEGGIIGSKRLFIDLSWISMDKKVFNSRLSDLFPNSPSPDITPASS
jgi:hypothetical protein